MTDGLDGASFDYIVVGAGTAGSALAGRLSENPHVTVLLLEAGPAAKGIMLRWPAGWASTAAPGGQNWGYRTPSSTQLDGRSMFLPTGRVLGGSSAINGMVYLRGHPEDYDAWARAGATGWRSQDVGPYFARVEATMRPERQRHISIAASCFLQACLETGQTALPAHSAAEGAAWAAALAQNGIAGTPLVTARGGLRHSTADGYLAAARRRPNLTIVTGTTVLRVTLEARRATGVIVRRAGQTAHVNARREVMLSAGAVQSPRLLLLSGIGPPDALRRLGLDCIVVAPEVGQGLQDHVCYPLTLRCKPEFSVNRQLRPPRLLAEVARFALFRRGPLGLSGTETCSFGGGKAGGQPTFQLWLRPLSLAADPDGRARIDHAPGVTLVVALLHPQARGWVRLPNADAAPEVNPCYLHAPGDLAALADAVEHVRPVLAATALRGWLDGLPPADPAALRRSIAAHAQPMHHLCGSCRIGNASAGVVDARLRVRGTDSLRVVDASVMPLTISANICAAAMMIGEKAANMIMEDRR